MDSRAVSTAYRWVSLSFLASCVLTLLFLAGAPALAAASSQDPETVVEHEVGPTPADIRSNWTLAEMMAAKPAEVRGPDAGAFDVPDFPEASISAKTGDYPIADPTAYPARIHGKVFFKVGDVSYQCSGTLVESRKGNVIYTAGHCVYDTVTRAFVTDLIFVPGYSDGQAPLGFYTATSLFTTSGWANSGDFSYDIGVVTVAGSPEADLGPGRKISFNQNPAGRKYTIFGYPADPTPTYNGQRLIACGAKVVARDSGNPRPLAAKPCNMGHGASGGGWITGGYLNSVTSYIYCESSPEACGFIFGPYFSKAARRIYAGPEVGGSVRPSFRIAHQPPRKVKKRKVVYRFAGEGSTPIKFKCSFDGRRYVNCGARTTISRLSPGKHVLRIQANDQTGKRAPGTLVSRFRVVR